ncbi:hypothetical protein [Streptomyces sp. NPDC050416]
MSTTNPIRHWQIAVALLACILCGSTTGPFTFDGRCETCADGIA